jgi:hypothetical protein
MNGLNALKRRLCLAFRRYNPLIHIPAVNNFFRVCLP